jgi:hypothetical protein
VTGADDNAACRALATAASVRTLVIGVAALVWAH